MATSGSWLNDLKRAEAAGDAAALRRLCLAQLERAPRTLVALAALGRTAIREGAPVEAVKWLGRAAAVAPKDASLRGDLGRAYQELGRDAEALDAYEAAVALDPRFVAAWTGLAQVHERLHRLDEAGEALGRARELSPGRRLLAVFAARLEQRRGDPAEARWRLEALLPELSEPAEEATALEGLAEALDALGGPAEAFAALDRAKAIRERLTPEAAQAAAAATDAAVDRTWAALDADRLRQWNRPVADGVRAPGFIVGFPRSGTTLVENVVAAHPGAVTTDEADLLDRTQRFLLQNSPPGFTTLQALESLRPEHLPPLRAMYLRAFEERMEAKIGDRMLVDKMPLNLFALPAVARLFPESPVVMVLRDPRAVCLSCYQKLGGSSAAAWPYLDLGRIADRYDRALGCWEAWKKLAPTPWIEIRYEDLVTSFEPTARRLLTGLGLPWEDAVLAFHEQAGQRYVRTPSYTGVGGRVHAGAVERWRRYEEQLAPILPRLQPHVERYGYDR